MLNIDRFNNIDVFNTDNGNIVIELNHNFINNEDTVCFHIKDTNFKVEVKEFKGNTAIIPFYSRDLKAIAEGTYNYIINIKIPSLNHNSVHFSGTITIKEGLCNE